MGVAKRTPKKPTHQQVGSMLADAQEMAMNHPDTFEAPSEADIGSIVPGSFVKVCRQDTCERFWVVVKRLNAGIISGSVNNELLLTDWPLHKKIAFPTKCVYAVMHLV
eukprot:5975331-Prymnesium_polylepis.1